MKSVAKCIIEARRVDKEQPELDRRISRGGLLEESRNRASEFALAVAALRGDDGCVVLGAGDAHDVARVSSRTA